MQMKSTAALGIPRAFSKTHQWDFYLTSGAEWGKHQVFKIIWILENQCHCKRGFLTGISNGYLVADT